MGKGYRVNNSIFFSGKPMATEEFINRMVEALDIIIDRSSKGRLRKKESQTIEKIGHISLS